MASSINIHTPLSSERISKFSCSQFRPLLKTSRAFCNRVTAVAENRDNLNHLQRITGQQTQQKIANQVASPGLWGRFPAARTVQQMMDTMDRTIEDPFAYSSTWPSVSPSERNRYSRGRAPWAIKEEAEDYKMRFDMPGMTKNDVKVWVEENMLVVKAEKVSKKTQSHENVEDIDDGEWPIKSYGRYSCRIALPENIEFEKIKAEVKDGVLYITIPKASTTSKVIDIDVQ